MGASIFLSLCRFMPSSTTSRLCQFLMRSASRFQTPAGPQPSRTAFRSTCFGFTPVRAIALATAVGQPLKIAAKVDPADRDYFEREIHHLLDHPLVEYIGEIDETQKDAFFGNASALLFPIDWPEPFGLVMIEAMACGVPVVAFRGGSVEEVIEDGVTGFIVDSVDEAIAATRAVRDLDRHTCRAVFEHRFNVTRMATDYLSVYEQLLSDRRSKRLLTGVW